MPTPANEIDHTVSKVNEYLYQCTQALTTWLNQRLPRLSASWWNDNVLEKLSFHQRKRVEEEKFDKLSDLDLSALLRITDKNWYELSGLFYLRQTDRDCVRSMIAVRNTWAHCSGIMPTKQATLLDLQSISDFLSFCNGPQETLTQVEQYRDLYARSEVVPSKESSTLVTNTIPVEPTSPIISAIAEKEAVYLVSNPDIIGIVMTVKKVGNSIKYEVFIDGTIRTYYEGQLAKKETKQDFEAIRLDELASFLTAFQINNPSNSDLYSLNSSRIDFVPYQFRPALKIIKSDTPRILIADSVGVGKTIETGLIIKELQARSELKNILVICPKPLVSERKWELEMKRFDEEFLPIDGPSLRHIVSETHRDGEWPQRYSKAIIPYSLLTNDLLFGKGGNRKKTNFGLIDLDPLPNFDMVIVDEAHHIRNSSTQAYAAVKYFCDCADSVVFLTATPLQTSDDDLFTLLNVLRPDVILDKDTFRTMSAPNEYVSLAVHSLRTMERGWQFKVKESLEKIRTTDWGANVVCQNPIYQRTLSLLSETDMTREQRVQLMTDIESLHSLSGMITRTRRQDIQDFCIRRTFTVESSFTEYQKTLHDELLLFEAKALALTHGNSNIRFMMTTIMRQAASCVFGLAPFIRGIVQRRFAQIFDDPDYDIDNEDDVQTIATIEQLSKNVLHLAEELPNHDPKYESMLKAIQEKQNFENNKVILFSTFRHTLSYLHEKLTLSGYRVGQVDGSVGDDDRIALRERFELTRESSSAIDILLFTEIGSEGLDYQFCNMMINYDLPWNPMRIEQRIGRIDRRGQKSDVVSIYNMITSDTIDADIYFRCLQRIGVFEKSIGDCAAILGDVNREINAIAFSPELSENERREKLEQIADNEVRNVHEMQQLEESEKQLFGFNLSELAISKEIQAAENPWINAEYLQSMIYSYLNARLGDGSYIHGESSLKQLRLSLQSRSTLLEDFRLIQGDKNATKKKWESYLRGSKPTLTITFDSDTANEHRTALFITTTHPLSKQAAEYFRMDSVLHISLSLNSNTYPKGCYPFALYSWQFVGIKPQSAIVSVCKNPRLQSEVVEIIQQAKDIALAADDSIVEQWRELEETHYQLWDVAKQKYRAEAESIALFRLESLNNNFRNRKMRVEKELEGTMNENIARMKQRELINLVARHEDKVRTINQDTRKADIHIRLLVNGLISINNY